MDYKTAPAWAMDQRRQTLMRSIRRFDRWYGRGSERAARLKLELNELEREYRRRFIDR